MTYLFDPICFHLICIYQKKVTMNGLQCVSEHVIVFDPFSFSTIEKGYGFWTKLKHLKTILFYNDIYLGVLIVCLRHPVNSLNLTFVQYLGSAVTLSVSLFCKFSLSVISCDPLNYSAAIMKVLFPSVDPCSK